MKTAIAFLAGLATAITQTNAFTTTSPLSVGKALPRLTEQTSASPFVQPTTPFQPAPLKKQEQQVDRSSIILHNALREFANWNDDWDVGGYGMGYGGYGRGVYRRGYGG